MPGMHQYRMYGGFSPTWGCAQDHFGSRSRAAGPNHVQRLLTCSVHVWLCVHTKCARNAQILHVWWIFTDLGVRTRPFWFAQQSGWAESCSTTSHMLSESLTMCAYQIRHERTDIARMVDFHPPGRARETVLVRAAERLGQIMCNNFSHAQWVLG